MPVESLLISKSKSRNSVKLVSLSLDTRRALVNY